MPTFFRKSKNSVRGKPQRTFAVHAPKKVGRKLKIKREDEPIQVTSPVTKKQAVVRADATLNVLDTLLQTSATGGGVKTHRRSEHENAVYRDEEDSLTEFNGISSKEEEKEFLGSVLDYERKRSGVVEEQIKLLEKEKEEEKKALMREIRTLKEELHRTTPIHDNKFFTLSKELRKSIEEIEHLASDHGVVSQINTPREEVLPEDLTQTPAVTQSPTPEIAQPKVVLVPQPAKPSVPAQQEGESQQTADRKPVSGKKLLITGASATVLVLVASGLMAGSLTGKAKVDEKIVNSYLESQSGQVQGAVSDSNTGTAEADPSQANVSFEESVWEEFKDANFGIMLQFPKNAVKPIRTDSNVTFIRKTGYLFKIQRIETALTAQEYWKQIMATSLNFEAKEEKFKGKPALKLELKDVTDYPGDRFLVKEGDYIYDVWYATPSNNFDQDDISRAEKMLASLSIIGTQ